MILYRTTEMSKHKLGEIKDGKFLKFIEFKKSFSPKYATLSIELDVLPAMLKHGVREIILTDVATHRTFTCPASLFVSKGQQTPTDANLRRMDPRTQKYWVVPLPHFRIQLADGTEVKQRIIRTTPEPENQMGLFS